MSAPPIHGPLALLGGKLGDDPDIEAWHLGDYIIEQVRLRNYRFCLGVQHHPERDPI